MRRSVIAALLALACFFTLAFNAAASPALSSNAPQHHSGNPNAEELPPNAAVPEALLQEIARGLYHYAVGQGWGWNHPHSSGIDARAERLFDAP